MRVLSILLDSPFLSRRSIHSRSWQAGFSEQARKSNRPFDRFRSPGTGAWTKDDSRYISLPTNQSETDGRNESTSPIRAKMQLAKSPQDLLKQLRAAVRIQKVDASVFGAAMQRCGQSSRWDTLLEVRSIQKNASLDLWPLQRNICLTALATCVRGKGFDTVPDRRKRLLPLSKQVWNEVGPARDADTFNSGLGAALKACAIANEDAGLKWVEELWSMALKQSFPVRAVAYETYALVLEVYRLPQRFGELLRACSKASWSPSVVVLGALVNAAAQQQNWRRAETLWEQLVVKHGVKPNSIAYGARAKAHFISGRPAETVGVVQEALLNGSQLDLRFVALKIQAALVVYPSSLSRADLDQMNAVLQAGKAIMMKRKQAQEWERMQSVAASINSSPTSMRLKDVLVSMNASRSTMATWPNHAAGLQYPKKDK